MPISNIFVPTEFNYLIFPIANLLLVPRLKKCTAECGQQIFLESEDTVYCLEAETSCSIQSFPLCIVAKKIDVQVGKVSCY